MRFSPDFIEKVRDANNIAEVIGQFVQLKRSGHRLVGLCPFHGEKTASFSVSEERQVYHCFGCKASGNIFHFLERYRGMSFPECVEYLAQRAAIAIPAEVREAQARGFSGDDREKQKLMWRINAFASQFYQMQLKRLPATHRVKTYLAERRLSQEVIEKFGLGYAPDDWTTLANALRAKGVPLEVASELGLIKRRNTEGHFDLFRHRLMFPIQSAMGNAIGFGGRVLGDDQPKYLNSPDSSVFHKGKVFYGLDETAKFIRAQDQAIVVEGYMDFLALYQAGLTHVVATLGTAFTPDHARVLKRHTRNVLVLFDGDDAGKQAAERSLPILLAEGLTPKGLTLENQLDPDEFIIERGVDALRAAIEAAPELFIQLMTERFAKVGTGASDRLQMIDEMAGTLMNVPDRRLKEIYADWFSDLFGTERAWAKRALVETMRQLTQKAAEAAPRMALGTPTQTEAKAEVMDSTEEMPELLRVVQPPKIELELLNVALMKEEYFCTVLDAGVVQEMGGSGIREIFRRAEELYRQMPSKFDSLTALLTSEVDPPSTLTLHLAKPLVDLQPGGAQKLIQDCIRKIRENNLRTKSRQLAAHLKGQTASAQLEKLEQIMNIHRDRHSLNRESES